MTVKTEGERGIPSRPFHSESCFIYLHYFAIAPCARTELQFAVIAADYAAVSSIKLVNTSSQLSMTTY